MRKWVVGGLVLCLASPVFGQGQSLSETATRVLAAQEPPAEYAAWAQRMDRAKTKRDGGKALLIGGLVVAGVGAALVPIAKWRNNELGGGDISPEDQFYGVMG